MWTSSIAASQKSSSPGMCVSYSVALLDLRLTRNFEYRMPLMTAITALQHPLVHCFLPQVIPQVKMNRYEKARRSK